MTDLYGHVPHDCAAGPWIADSDGIHRCPICHRTATEEAPTGGFLAAAIRRARRALEPKETR